jgi:hypothetical protein
VGVPIVRDRLFYSFIWDRFGNVEIDEKVMMDAGIRIDPTNKNINLKEEIKKLVNKDKEILMKEKERQKLLQDQSVTDESDI